MSKSIKSISSYIIVILAALLIKQFVFSPIRVNGTSMYPTLHDGDFMILNEAGFYIKGLKRFDIVVVKIDGERLIKRVIGMPGDKVKYYENKLYINDEEIKEEFEHDVTHNFELSEIGYDTVPEGFYFVVGDNRGNSNDSRKFGLVRESQIKGKARLIIFPFSRMGIVK